MHFTEYHLYYFFFNSDFKTFCDQSSLKSIQNFRLKFGVMSSYQIYFNKVSNRVWASFFESCTEGATMKGALKGYGNSV